MQINAGAIFDKAAFLDYVLVPICLGIWAFTGNWVWGVCALVSLFTAWYKPLPRFHRWMMRRLFRRAHSR